MAVSFNGCTIAITPSGGTETTYGLRSLTFGGGTVAAIDVTAANSGRRLQLPGLREPYQIQIEALAPISTNQPASGASVSWTIAGNTTMTTSGSGWYVESIEVTGSVDEVNVISMTLIEGSGAT
jgi:hypothetical protein